MSEIVIASTSIDEPTYGPVVEKLAARGYDSWVYLADRVASGADLLSISVGYNDGIQVTYNGELAPLDSAQAAWYRHPNLFGFDSVDKGKQMCMEQEISDLQESLWLLVPENAWLNSPYSMQKAQAKLAQLAIARELGFEIPETVVSNNWQQIDEALKTDDIIVKMSRGLLYEGDGIKTLYTTRLTPDIQRSIRSMFPFPAIYQQYAPKHREWRVTVVGDEVFDAAIYTSPEAKDDWRVHQLTDKVTFKKETIRDDIHKLCAKYLGHFGLTYGAFDFIEDADGKITFLECNSNGQFRWLEELLDIPISDAIVDSLIKKVE